MERLEDKYAHEGEKSIGAGTKAEVVPREKLVPEKLCNLDSKIGEVERLTALLEERLSPVLLPQPTASRGEELAATGVPLVDTLLVLTFRLEGVTNRMNAVLETIEL
jgi:hypothetical protein